jgi:Na+-transporting methylmalonyl-CoA/oxaloacetate decarboxylase gamma subunit
MEIILLIVFTFVVWMMGAVSGWNAREKQAKEQVEKHFQRIQEFVEEQEEEQIHIIIEKHNDMLFVYDKETKQFMAQGTSKEDVEKVLIERFPGKRFACHESTLKEVGFIS